MIYKYIFYKVYFFYIKVFKETEIPHWFAAGILAIIIIGNLQVLIDIYSYFLNPETIGIYTSYNKYLVLVLGFSLMFYVSKQHRYLKIIKDCEQLPKRKKKVLGYLSVLYVIILFGTLGVMGELIRDYNQQ